MVVPNTRKPKSVGYHWGLIKRLTTQPSSCNNTAILLGTLKKRKVQRQLSERQPSKSLQRTTVTRKKPIWSQAYLAFTISTVDSGLFIRSYFIFKKNFFFRRIYIVTVGSEQIPTKLIQAKKILNLPSQGFQFTWNHYISIYHIYILCL